MTLQLCSEPTRKGSQSRFRSVALAHTRAHKMAYLEKRLSTWQRLAEIRAWSVL